MKRKIQKGYIASVCAYINPIVAVLLGWLMLQKEMNLNMISGSIIMLLIVYLVHREYIKQMI